MACETEQAQVASVTQQLEDAKTRAGQSHGADKAAALQDVKDLMAELATAKNALADCQAANPPGPVHVELLEIHGIERTQATQFFLVNGKGSGAAPDNSVPRLALRELNLRVYVAEKWTPLLPRRVTGRVRYRQLDPPHQSFPDLYAVNGSIDVGTVQQLDRANAGATLNFRVPAWNCGGTVEFTVEVFEAPPVVLGAAIAAAPAPVLSLTWIESFTPVPPLRVHVVLIHYNGPDRWGTGTLDVAAPTAWDVAASFNYIASTYPVGAINFTACDEIEWNTALNLPTGDIGWSRLFNALGEIRDGGDKRDLFVGLIPVGCRAAACLASAVEGLALAYGRDGPVLAQEMGHSLGRMHAPCGMPGNPDPSYPTYASYPPASIGEFGVDTATFAIFDPATTVDFMSYCAPRWISPYTYLGLLQGIQSRFASAARTAELGDAADQGDPAPQALHPRRRRSGPVPASIVPGGSSRRQASRSPSGSSCWPRTGPSWSPTAAASSTRRRIPTGPRSTSKRRCPGTGTPRRSRSFATDASSTRSRSSGRHLLSASTARRSRSTRPPSTGTPSTPEGELSYVVDYSNDDGATWRTVAPSRSSTSLTVDLRRLPGGERCLFRVLATSGIRTAVAMSSPFEVPRKRRKALIASPSDGDSVKAGEPLVLVGGGFSPDYGLSAPEEIVWTSDVDGLIARGLVAAAPALSPGPHTIRVAVADGEGRSSSARVRVTAG